MQVHTLHCRFAPGYAADSSVPIFDRGRNTIEKEIGSCTKFVDNYQIVVTY